MLLFSTYYCCCSLPTTAVVLYLQYYCCCSLPTNAVVLSTIMARDRYEMLPGRRCVLSPCLLLLFSTYYCCSSLYLFLLLFSLPTNVVVLSTIIPRDIYEMLPGRRCVPSPCLRHHKSSSGWWDTPACLKEKKRNTNSTVGFLHRKRINSEENAKDVAAVWETEFI